MDADDVKRNAKPPMHHGIREFHEPLAFIRAEWLLKLDFDFSFNDTFHLLQGPILEKLKNLEDVILNDEIGAGKINLMHRYLSSRECIARNEYSEELFMEQSHCTL